jgi:UDP-glucuronate decarboxylase
MATPAAVAGPINLGNPEEFSIQELATLAIEMTGSRSKIVHRPRPEDDPRQRRPDISRAQETLGWKPKTKLKEGLSRTIAYFEQLLAEADVRAMLSAERERALPDLGSKAP